MPLGLGVSYAACRSACSTALVCMSCPTQLLMRSYVRVGPSACTDAAMDVPTPRHSALRFCAIDATASPALVSVSWGLARAAYTQLPAPSVEAQKRVRGEFWITLRLGSDVDATTHSSPLPRGHSAAQPCVDNAGHSSCTSSGNSAMSSQHTPPPTSAFGHSAAV